MNGILRRSGVSVALALFLGALLVSWLTHGTDVVKNDIVRNIHIADELIMPFQVKAAYNACHSLKLSRSTRTKIEARRNCVSMRELALSATRLLQTWINKIRCTNPRNEATMRHEEFYDY